MIEKEETEELKGVSILMIIFQHMSRSFGFSFLNPFGPIGVCLFLYLSGYGLTISFKKNGRNHYVRKRILKVYVPYLITVLMFVFWTRIIYEKFLSPIQILRYVLLLDYMQGSYWFLTLMFYWYIVFYVLTYVFDNKKLLVCLLAVGSLLIIMLTQGNRLFIWQFFSFPAGVVSACYQEKVSITVKKYLKIKVISIILLGAFLLMALKKTSYVEKHELGFADTLLQILVTLDVAIFTFLLNKFIRTIRWIRNSTSFIGGISYELYLAHTMPMDYLDGSLSRFFVYCICVLLVLSVLLVIRNVQVRWKKHKWCS